MDAKAKAKIGEVMLILGTVLFVGGAMCYLRGALPAADLWNRCSGAHLCGCWCGHDESDFEKIHLNFLI